MRSSPAVFSSKFSTEPRGEPTDSGSRWTCTERERAFPSGRKETRVPWGSAAAGSASWAGAQLREGGTEPLPPPHTPPPRPRPSQRSHATASHGRGGGELEPRRSPLPQRGRQAAPRGTWPGAARISCAQLVRTYLPGGLRAGVTRERETETERGWRERTRGVGETERAKNVSATLLFYHPVCCARRGGIQSPPHPST